jgi:hypothetical protein
MHLSTVGYFHTFFGLFGVVLAFYMLIRDRQIDPKSSAGIAYFVAVTVSCILVFALPRNAPGFNPVPGYVLTLLTLTSLFVGFFIRFSKIRTSRYIETLGLSGSLFFSMVPAINETLTRLPVSAPLASSPQDPLVLKSLGVMAVLILALCVAQVVKIRKSDGDSNIANATSWRRN